MWSWLFCGLLWAGLASCCLGQQGGGGAGGGGQGGGQLPGGILIRPGGLIDRAALVSSGGISQRSRRQQAEKALSAELRVSSERRTVSLRRLDEELLRHQTEATPLPPEVRHLAGLTRIDEIRIDESGDVLLTGPGELFAPSVGGRLTGLDSGRPVLCLEDLLEAIRTEEILDRCGCSIDPDPERLAESQAWLRQNSSPATLQIAQARLENMVRLMGRWNVTTFGVPEDSRLSLSMVEADYLMKRLAIGVDRSPVGGLKSTLQLAKPGDNMMRRWWFAADPGYLACSADQRLWVLGGPRFQLLAQEELLAADGTLIDSDHAKGSSEEFARLFNERRAELARRISAFADLQNVFDVLVAAAIFRRVMDGGGASWTPMVLRDSGAFASPSRAVPRETLPLLTTRQVPGGPLIGAFSGGVMLKAKQLLQVAGSLPRDAEGLGVVIPAGRWWSQREKE